MSKSHREVEHYDRRFGIIAIESGFITIDALAEALRVQIQENLDRKSHRLTGQILMDRGHMTPDQVEAVLRSLFSDHAGAEASAA
jgi:hypothetical protein